MIRLVSLSRSTDADALSRSPLTRPDGSTDPNTQPSRPACVRCQRGKDLRCHFEQMLRHRACGGSLDQRGQAYAGPLQLQLDRITRRRKVRIIERVAVSDRRAVRLREACRRARPCASAAQSAIVKVAHSVTCAGVISALSASASAMVVMPARRSTALSQTAWSLSVRWWPFSVKLTSIRLPPRSSVNLEGAHRFSSSSTEGSALRPCREIAPTHGFIGRRLTESPCSPYRSSRRVRSPAVCTRRQGPDSRRCSTSACRPD
jgi:hypothetical protein